MVKEPNPKKSRNPSRKQCTTKATTETPAPLKQPYILPPKQCKENEHGKFLIFRFSQPYMKKLNDEEPLIQGPLPEKRNLPPGVYTWVIIFNPSLDRRRIYLKRSPNVQEIASKHKDIVTSIKEQYKVEFAGELQVYEGGSGKANKANLLSGTFTRKLMGDAVNAGKLPEFQADADGAIRAMLGQSFDLDNVDVDTSGTGDTLITGGLSDHDLQRFIRDSIEKPAEIKIYGFDTFAECNAVKGELLKSGKDNDKLLTAKSAVTYNHAAAAAEAAADRYATIGSATSGSATSGSATIGPATIGPATSRSATSGSATIRPAASGAGAATEMSRSEGASIGGAFITRRHRLRGRTRKIKRKRTTTKKKNKRNKRSNKRKKYLKYT
uniref:Uncharacterized protein n=1 Tax=viral metagenome TaxID=1070528 RepID=A0A6C0BSK0_9ZZZZ